MMRRWNALISLNMHAVELRCGDTGQKKKTKQKTLKLPQGEFGTYCAAKKPNEKWLSVLEDICNQEQQDMYLPEDVAF